MSAMNSPTTPFAAYPQYFTSSSPYTATFSTPTPTPSVEARIVVTARAIRRDSGGEVVVRHLHDDVLAIGWYCGEERVFDSDGIYELIEMLEDAATDGVWLGTSDRNDESIYLLLAGDKLYAAEEPEQGDWVSFAALTKTVKKTLKGKSRGDCA